MLHKYTKGVTMSEFRVKLNNAKQGLLDLDPTSASSLQFSVSKQRTMFVTGPKRKIRELKDGDTFTDCNYWKRFAVPEMAEDAAFIEIISDDGSIYSDIESENVFPAFSNITVAQDSAFTANLIDFYEEYGSHATFLQIQNSSDYPCEVKLNGSSSAVFTLAENSTQVFNGGDLIVTKINFAGDSGGSTEIQVLAALKSVINS